MVCCPGSMRVFGPFERVVAPLCPGQITLGNNPTVMHLPATFCCPLLSLQCSVVDVERREGGGRHAPLSRRSGPPLLAIAQQQRIDPGLKNPTSTR